MPGIVPVPESLRVSAHIFLLTLSNTGTITLGKHAERRKIKRIIKSAFIWDLVAVNTSVELYLI